MCASPTNRKLTGTELSPCRRSAEECFGLLFVKFQFVLTHPYLDYQAAPLNVFDHHQSRIMFSWDTRIQFGIVGKDVVVNGKVVDQI